MAKNIIEFSAATAVTESYSNYTSSKTILGPSIKVWTGSDASQYYVGTPPITFQDPTQDTGLSNWGDIDAITYSGSKQWVFALRGFAITNGNAEIAAWEFDKNTYQYTYKGRTTIIPPTTATAGTWQGIKANLEYYSTGSVEVNGTTVVGTGTNFIADRIPVGARIGFGSTNPSDITTWYRISSYPSMSLKTGFNAGANCVAVDPSGSLYVGGNFTTYQGVTANRIIKLNSDGTIDSSFNSGAGFNAAVTVIRIDASGSLYVGGAFTTYSGSTNNYIIKLNTDGTKDTSFDNTTGFNGVVYDIQFDSTGSLWCGGAFTTYKGASTPRLAKILTTGLRDTTYITTSSPNTNVLTIAVDSNDDVYIGGNFTQVGATANNSRYIAKILKTGGLDSTFVVGTAGTSNAFNSLVNTIYYKSSTNSIVVGGAFSQWKGTSGNASLVELSSIGDVIKGTSAPTTVYSMVTNGTDLYVNLSSITVKYNLSTLESDNSSTSPTFCPNITYDALNGLWLMALSLDNSKLYVPSGDTTVDAGLVVVDTTYGNHDLTFATTPDYTSQVLSIDSSAGTLSAGTPYVVENLQLTMVSNQNGIVFMQGISWDDFTLAGTTISTPSLDYAALNKGAYRLRDRGYNETLKYFNIADSLSGWNDTRNNPKQNESVNYLYIRGTSNNFSRLNLKDSQLRIHGANVQANIAFSTLDQVILPNSLGISNFASGKFTIGTMQTGSASGSYSIYGDTNTGIVQIDIDSLSNYGTPTYTQMTETPPGSTTTYTAAGNVSRVYYMPAIDRLIVLNASATANSYITNFRTDLQFPTLTGTLYGRDTYNQLAIDNSYDLAFLANSNQLQGNTANAFAPRYPDTLGTGFFGAVENGVLHLCRPLNTIQNNMYAVPIGCEAQFVDFSNEVFITPKYTLPNVVAISGLYVNSLKQYGSAPFALPPEPIIIHYRTSGIDDNSGAWTEYTTIDALNDSLECEGVLQTINIQFRFSYKIAGNTCLPNRIYGFTLVYEDDRTDSHYTPSVAESSLTNRIFAWQQVESWYGNIPELKIRLYNAANNKIVYYDTTVSSDSGTWEYSTDGVTWLPWNATADNVGNYIRYTADFIPSGIKLRVGLNRI